MRVCDRCREFNANAEQAWWAPLNREAAGWPGLGQLRWKDLCDACFTELNRRLQDVMDRG